MNRRLGVPADAQRATVSRFVDEVVNDGPKASDEIVLDQEFRAFLRTLRGALPDLYFELDRIEIEGGEVAARGAASGTHQGPFEDLAPTGRYVTIPGTLFVRFAEERIEQVRFEPERGEIRDHLLPESQREIPWYKWWSGGFWEPEGNRQLRFLQAEGMQPHHYLLDVGCGTLRGGVKCIPYLERGHYWGVDSDAAALWGGNEAIRELGLEQKEPHLVYLTDFDFASLEQRFDYYLAYSVFTEIPLNSIIRCVMNIDRVLAPGARFYATFWENVEGKRNLAPIEYHRKLVTHFDEYPYHYDFGTFEWICEGTGLHVEHLGSWCGRGPQRTVVFSRKESPR